MDGPLLVIVEGRQSTAVLASQIVFVQQGRVWTSRSGSIPTYISQEEVVVA